MQARAHRRAAESARRTNRRASQSLLDGGFVSPNEAEMKSSRRARPKQAELLAEKAKLIGTSLEVNDCILRSPVRRRHRHADHRPRRVRPPRHAIVSVVDRTTVRMTADVPENDFEHVAPRKQVDDSSSMRPGRTSSGTITRRAPAADPGTRTVHFEVDIPDPKREIPVGHDGRGPRSKSEQPSPSHRASRSRRRRSRARRRRSSSSRATSPTQQDA